ncbi:bifunctional GNAT family N-acetyltransferase/NUDIX hydrolase [Streptomyces sp. NPDC046928]|uniref:bifunctional GNAT family N-acetyltransferase/NUDIX hydrolase n=1 Tax=Streptomyces sp. NPDC046928 TaxID=3155021 RepID=UPI003404E092
MILAPLPLTADHDIPAPLLTELTALYASNRAFQALSGDFPDPDDIRPEQVAAALADELAVPGAEVLLARSAGRLVGVVITLARHPDPEDPDPWIGLLMVDASAQRQGHGTRLAALVEERLRAEGRTGVRLAVLDGNAPALAFWTSLGYEPIGHGEDREHGRPCTVLRKSLPGTPRAVLEGGRVAVLDPTGAVFLFRYADDEAGPHWALPGGAPAGDESPREAAARELRAETGWTDLEPGPLLATWDHDFTHQGIPIRRREHIYLALTERREPTGPRLGPSGDILGWHWWTARELLAPREPLWPPDLARLLAAYGEDGDA